MARCSIRETGLNRTVRAAALLFLLGLSLYLALRPGFALLHELAVLLAADCLVWVGDGAARLASSGPFPFDPVYTSTLFFIVADVDVLGVAVAPPLGDVLRSLWPGLFTTPDLLAEGAFASAVIGPGASVVARGAIVLSGDVLMLVLGLALLRVGSRDHWATVGRGIGRRAIGARFTRRSLAVVGALVQAHVLVNHLVDRSASLADLEAAGLTYGFSVLFSGPASERPRVSELLEPLPGPVQDGLLALIVVSLAYLLAGIVFYGPGRVWRLLRRARPAPANRVARSRRRGSIRLALARVGLPAFAIIVVLSPLGSLAEASSRLLEAEASEEAVYVIDTPIPTDSPVPLVAASPPAIPTEQPQPVPSPLVARLEPARPSPSPPISFSPRLVRPPTIVVEGSDYHYAYLVDGEPTVIRAMGYNPVYLELPVEERQARLARDFLEMRQAGVDTVLGWTTAEFDDILLDQAQQSGLGVILPFDLRPDLDFTNPDLRDSLRGDVLSWIGRYRGHPALRMWGIGNEVLHKLVYPSWMRLADDPLMEARAVAFAEWYVDLIDEIHRLDPDHPIVYRDAEDAYLPRLRTALNASGIQRPWFVYGINIYTPRLAAVLKSWPSKGLDAALLISEFAPGGASPADRPHGYREMWGMIRSYPEQVLGGAPYVWTTEGPEEVDRVFGLVNECGEPVDGSLAMIGQMFQEDDGGAAASAPTQAAVACLT